MLLQSLNPGCGWRWVAKLLYHCNWMWGSPEIGSSLLCALWVVLSNIICVPVNMEQNILRLNSLWAKINYSSRGKWSMMGFPSLSFLYAAHWKQLSLFAGGAFFFLCVPKTIKAIIKGTLPSYPLCVVFSFKTKVFFLYLSVCADFPETMRINCTQD